MSELSRRSFLKQGGATAAAAGALMVTPKALSRKPPATKRAGAVSKSRATSKASNRTLVAHVPDVRKDEVRVLVGEREIVIHDRALVTRLARAAD
jgi:TAT (twin-arginine translocation) pathway signal sequence